MKLANFRTDSIEIIIASFPMCQGKVGVKGKAPEKL